MATSRKDVEPEQPKPDYVVKVMFAYATTVGGEVKQLTKGDQIFADQYRPESLEHLASIGFIGKD